MRVSLSRIVHRLRTARSRFMGGRFRLLMADFTEDRVDHHLVLLVLLHLAELDAHPFAVGARDMFADVIGLQRNLAMAAVDENREADGSRPADFENDAERGLDRLPSVNDVIDNDYRPVLEA